MFSSRLKGGFEPNRIGLSVENRRRAGAELLDLTVSNPTQAGLRYPAEQITAALGTPRALTYEPHPLGLPEVRHAVANRYRGVAPERIILTSSTSEAYSFLFKLLCDPGDEVLTPHPSYPLFDFLAELESVRIRHYPLFYDGCWAIDTGAVRNAITPRSRAVVVVNPNNPTGSFLKRAEYAELAQICKKAGLAIISDEVFAGYAFEEASDLIPTLSGSNDVLTFSLDGLSKSAGLPQMKLAWIVVSGPDDQVSDALRRLELIADTFLSVNTPVQCAAGELIRSGETVRAQIRARTGENLRFLRDSLASTAFSVLNAEAGWYAIVQAPRTRTEEQWVLGLIEDCGVLVQPGYFYDFAAEPFLVLSLLTPGDVFREGVRRFILHGSCG